MKTPAFIIAVIFLSFAAAFPAQTKYSVPKNIAIESIVEEAFPSYFGHEYPQLIAENFFPIGWSRDGKFAYYVEPVDEACGCYFGRLVIQDMRTDKVLWEYRYSQDSEFDEKGEMSGSDSIDELWTKNAKLFSAKLSGHRIVQTQNLELLDRNFQVNGRHFQAEIAVVKGENPGMGPRVNKLSLSVNSPELGSKIVYTSDHSSDEYWFMLDAGVIGAIKSPFERRAAIVMAEVMRGYEGPPHTADLRLVGADMVNGFGRK